VIKYEPSKIVKRFASDSKVKKLITQGASLNKIALQFIADLDFVDSKALRRLVLKTLKEYKKRFEEQELTKAEQKKELRNPKQLVHRVQNLVVTEVSKEIRSQYKGRWYEWLPSDAAEPDPQHQLKYGKRYRVGVGEMPGDRYGCRCGMRIITDDSRLNLN
jgi:acyl carrier protein